MLTREESHLYVNYLRIKHLMTFFLEKRSIWFKKLSRSIGDGCSGIFKNSITKQTLCSYPKRYWLWIIILPIDAIHSSFLDMNSSESLNQSDSDIDDRTSKHQFYSLEYFADFCSRCKDRLTYGEIPYLSCSSMSLCCDRSLCLECAFEIRRTAECKK